MYYFNKEALYPPTHIQQHWSLHSPTEEFPVWKQQWFGNSCAYVVLIITYDIPVLKGHRLGVQRQRLMRHCF